MYEVTEVHRLFCAEAQTDFYSMEDVYYCICSHDYQAAFDIAAFAIVLIVQHHRVDRELTPTTKCHGRAIVPMAH